MDSNQKNQLQVRLASVPFLNNPNKSKDRPVVVIGHPDKKHTMILPITSKYRHKAYIARAARFPIGFGGNQLNLSKQSYVDTDNLMTLPNHNVRYSKYGYLGSLNKQQSITILKYGAKFQKLSSEFYKTRNTHNIAQFKKDAHIFDKNVFMKFHSFHRSHLFHKERNHGYVLPNAPKANLGIAKQSWSGKVSYHHNKPKKAVSVNQAKKTFMTETKNNHNQALLSAFRAIRMRRQQGFRR